MLAGNVVYKIVFVTIRTYFIDVLLSIIAPRKNTRVIFFFNFEIVLPGLNTQQRRRNLSFYRWLNINLGRNGKREFSKSAVSV